MNLNKNRSKYLITLIILISFLTIQGLIGNLFDLLEIFFQERNY